MVMNCLAASGTAVLFLCAFNSVSHAQTLGGQALWEALEPENARVGAAPAADHWFLAKSYGPSGAPTSNGNGPAISGIDMSESELGSIGCLIGGTIGTAGAIALGGQNVINPIAGGLVLPATPGSLYASLFGVVFASFCSVGQAMTPATLYAYRRIFGRGRH